MIPLHGLFMMLQRASSNNDRAWQMFCVAFASVLLSSCATAPTYTGTFTGHAERYELYTRGGEVFFVTKFTVEAPLGKIRMTGNQGPSASDVRQQKVFLVDPCYTAYPAERFAGERLEVWGTICLGEIYPFPGGPALFDPSPGKTSTVLIVKAIGIDKLSRKQGMESSRGVKPRK